MSGYRSNDDWPDAPVDRDSGNRRLNVSWVLLSLGVGIAVVFFVSRFASGGTAEIAGIIAGSLVMNLRGLWEYRVTRWFLPLTAGWIFVHLCLLIFVVAPMKVQESRVLINLIWVEYLAFGGLGILAERLWGGIPEG